ncbi:MAG: tRNA (guanosine(46)-N7)-methyltransferase TrmB [Erysipelotrichaceae bacterium]|nr:tRNA (guanosine(46)-N7)-methyltransferase TrmB [Erysipelotrichaceae bacterium]
MKNKKWSIPFLNEHKEIVLYEVSYDNELLKDFINHQPLYLEIGTGKGDFILNMAKNNPNTHFIGIEKSITCLAITAKKIVNEDIKNVLLIADDVSKVFAYLPQGSIDKLFLNFSDPWPKKRHEKRRLTYKTFLDEYKKILKSNGEIIMKTDNIDLFNYSIESFTSNGFILEQVNFDYDGLDTNDVMTEYERFFRDEGTKINKLVAKVGSNNEIK